MPGLAAGRSNSRKKASRHMDSRDRRRKNQWQVQDRFIRSEAGRCLATSVHKSSWYLNLHVQRIIKKKIGGSDIWERCSTNTAPESN